MFVPFGKLLIKIFQDYKKKQCPKCCAALGKSRSVKDESKFMYPIEFKYCNEISVDITVIKNCHHLQYFAQQTVSHKASKMYY